MYIFVSALIYTVNTWAEDESTLTDMDRTVKSILPTQIWDNVVLWSKKH